MKSKTTGHRTNSTAGPGALILIVPDGLSLSRSRSAIAALMSTSAGDSRCRSRVPASVGATLRVVLLSKRMPSAFSRAFTD